MNIQKLPKEWDYLKSLQKIVHRNKPGTLVPLGDDAFVTTTNHKNLAMCQDMMIEGVHFDLQYSSAADIGHKSLAVNLSDFAAMGAEPQWAQVSLGLTEKQNKSWLDEFYLSMAKLADQYNIEIVGGDLCSSPHSLVIDVSVTGHCPHPITRTGAQPGDLLLCSGPLGASAFGLRALKSCLNAPESIRRHLRPTPRLDLLPELQKSAPQIHALIDISDGLVNEALLLSRHQEIGLEIDLPQIPLLDEYLPQVDFALWGGEDYELLLVIPETQKKHFSHWHTIGKFNSSKEIALVHDNGRREVITEFKGWQHFA